MGHVHIHIQSVLDILLLWILNIASVLDKLILKLYYTLTEQQSRSVVVSS